MNWMREKRRPSAARERAHEQRLRRARHALDQHVAAREKRHQRVVDGRLLADDAVATAS